MRIGIHSYLSACCNSVVKPSAPELLTLGEVLDGCLGFLTLHGSIWIFQFSGVQSREVTHFNRCFTSVSFQILPPLSGEINDWQ